MKIKKLFVLVTTVMLSFVVFYGCKKKDNILRELYKVYQNGEIIECKYQGKIVYSATINAYDAPSVMYDKNGNQIGSCNYAWSKPDPICGKLKTCEVVYRVENNIWGSPAVDKYELGK